MGTESGEGGRGGEIGVLALEPGIPRDILSCTMKERPANDDSGEDESYVSPNFPRPPRATLARGQFVSHAVCG